MRAFAGPGWWRGVAYPPERRELPEPTGETPALLGAPHFMLDFDVGEPLPEDDEPTCELRPLMSEPIE